MQENKSSKKKVTVKKTLKHRPEVKSKREKEKRKNSTREHSAPNRRRTTHLKEIRVTI